MMTRSVVLGCFLTIVAACCVPTGGTLAATASPDSLFARASALYASGRHAEAVDVYHDLIERGHGTVEVYANLGNAQFKNGRLAQSILAYRRALRLAPDDEDLMHNLHVAEARLRDRVEPMPLLFVAEWWNARKEGNTTSTLFWWTVLPLWLLAAAVFVFFGIASIALRRVALAFGAAMLVLWLSSIALYLDRVEDDRGRRGAVVMAAEVQVRSTADASGVDTFIVHEGLTVEVLEEQGTLSRIRLADGKDGWVPSDAIERI